MPSPPRTIALLGCLLFLADARSPTEALRGGHIGVTEAAPVEPSPGLSALSFGAGGRLDTALMQQDLGDDLKGGAPIIVVGFLVTLVAIPAMWFNEERSVRLECLTCRGLAECLSVGSEQAQKGNAGSLVHVQGHARGAVPLADAQFEDAVAEGVLKLQSTVEVFEWAQTTRLWQEGEVRRVQPRFHTEWVTTHNDSQRFRKPSPENPRLPSGLVLGTSTAIAQRATLGGFALPKEMVNAFRSFEPAMRLLPPRVTAHGITFFANEQDGYYYARPGLVTPVGRRAPPARLFQDHQVGDLRCRFLCVPETQATVVAVQCRRADGLDTFVPYRPVPRAPWAGETQARQRLLEEGDKHIKDIRREMSCCGGTTTGVATMCCCPCNAVSCFCAQEVVTEEIFFATDKLVPVELPFQMVVTRSPLRVWNFRLLGWALTFLGLWLMLRPFAAWVQGVPVLHIYGSLAHHVLALAATLTTSMLTVAAVYFCYEPSVAWRWVLAAALVACLPFVAGRASPLHPAAG